MAGYTTSNGQVFGPNGQPFVADGIDVMEGDEPTVAQLQTDFPGINFVRLAIYDYASPQALSAYVTSLTNAGIVVELEDHNNGAGNAGGSAGTIFTGAELTDELNWYSSIATAFANNPNVWFGTNNEPSETDANGNNDPAALSAWQAATYNAIRSTGNTAPVMLEANSWGPGNTNVGYVASDYASMTNTIWDVHYYGWLSNYSTNQTTVTQTLDQIAADTNVIPNAQGTMPVLIGEYGNSTSGATIDPNADQVITAVQQSGFGSAAWAWGVGNPGDGLSNSDGTASSYGQMVASGIAAAAAAAPSATVTPPPAVMPVASFADSAGNAWGVVGGVVYENGATAGYSANVIALEDVNGTVWQENASDLWWSWTGNGWSTGGGTATAPVAPVAPIVPTTPTVPSAPAPATTSANDTAIVGTAGAITDAAGNTWTITAAGTVDENGAAAAYSAGVNQIAYVNGAVWQENAAGDWWEWTGTNWNTGGGTSVSPLPASAPVTPTVPAPVINITAGGVTQAAVLGTTVDGDTFTAGANGSVLATLGGTSAFISFIGGSGVNVTGGSAGAIVLATTGNNTFTAGSAPMDVTGGSGADTYVFHAGSGFLAVNDFSAAKGDTLSIDTGLKSAMTQSSDGAGGTLISFAGNAAIDLHGVTSVPASTIHFS